jgi:membrane protein implicated in regulation of membrane protease activity
MSDVKLAHPSREQLSAFGSGQLDDAGASAIADHLAACADCRTVLETLPADTFVAKLRSLTQPDAALPRGQIGDCDPHEAPTCTGASVAPAGDFEVPAELAQHPRYRILQLLGAGGMGVVYKAEHQLMERPVALKVIHHTLIGEAGAVERFRREVRGAARLTHPNIVTAYDAEQAGDTHFLVMEFVEGMSLDRWVQSQGPLPVAEACQYVRQAALGLQHALERGMVHRDIKPANLMRTPDGQIKILDFGLARFVQESRPAAGLLPSPAADQTSARPGETSAAAASLTKVGTVVGTPDYMAPEQAANSQAADIRADIYSLGCTLYHLLAGQVPFPEGTVVDKLLAHMERQPRPLTELRRDLPAELVRVVERMLAKDPAERYQSPNEVAEALAPGLHAAVAPGDVPASHAALPPRQRWRGLAVAAAGLGAASLLLALFIFWQSEREETLSEYLTTLYTICAVLGGTLLGCQFLLTLLGFGHHHDIGGHEWHDVGGHDLHGGQEHDVAHETQMSWFVSMLTFRTIVAALTFFGLAGRAAGAAEFAPAQTLTLALAAGAGALFLVAWLMRSMSRLQADGSVRMERAVGQTGTVYLPIPPHRSGMGKVLLNLQNRTVECQAVTDQESLPSGTRIRVVAIVNPNTVEVILSPTSERITHV